MPATRTLGGDLGVVENPKDTQGVNHKQETFL